MKHVPKRYLALASVAAFGLAPAMIVRTRNRLAGLHGKVVLITGGSRGLGLALAREFGRLRCSIVIRSRTEDQLNTARELLEAEGFRVLTIPCDVTDAVAPNLMRTGRRLQCPLQRKPGSGGRLVQRRGVASCDRNGGGARRSQNRQGDCHG